MKKIEKDTGIIKYAVKSPSHTEHGKCYFYEYETESEAMEKVMELMMDSNDCDNDCDHGWKPGMEVGFLDIFSNAVGESHEIRLYDLQNPEDKEKYEADSR